MESYVEMHHNEWLLRPPSSTDFTAGPGTFKSSSSLTHHRVAQHGGMAAAAGVYAGGEI